MKPNYVVAFCVALGLLVSPVEHSNAVTLTVPLIGQQKNQWCWNACSLMVMNHLAVGPHPSQQMVADWAIGGYNFPNGMGRDAIVANYVKDQFGVGNPAAAVTVTKRGISGVLENFVNNVKCTLHGQITPTELQGEIDNDRPVIARIGWYKTAASYNASNNDGGGHFVCVIGFDGTTMDINDPWPVATGDFYTVPLATFQGSASYPSNAMHHRWTHTLKIAGSLDIVFLIDSTGSMGDDIANVKANVNTLIDDIANRFKDYRIAVVDYKDYPQSPYGSAGDYVYNVKASFAGTNAAAAKAAINTLSASGGNDWPESVYSALNAVVDGTAIGGWRPDPVERNVFLLGDAPGHDPEPWTGGTNSGVVLAKAKVATKLIHVHTLLVGGDVDAKAMFDTIAGSSGGVSKEADSASEVSESLSEIVEEIDENQLFPRGPLANFLPTFSFIRPTGGMEPEPSAVELQIMKFDNVTWFWKAYLTAVIPKGISSYSAKSPFPLGRYQWRVNSTVPTHFMFLPNNTSIKVIGGKRYGDGWTEFQRILAPPGDPSALSPYPYGTSLLAGTVTYSWSKAATASSHAVQIFQAGKLWKNLIVKEPAKPTNETRTLKIAGHKLGTTYSWKVQGLNYDRPKADPTAWTP